MKAHGATSLMFIRAAVLLIRVSVSHIEPAWQASLPSVPVWRLGFHSNIKDRYTFKKCTGPSSQRCAEINAQTLSSRDATLKILLAPPEIILFQSQILAVSLLQYHFLIGKLQQMIRLMKFIIP